MGIIPNSASLLRQPTKDYMARCTREGLSKKEIIRCLKRYVAREVYRALLASHELVRAA